MAQILENAYLIVRLNERVKSLTEQVKTLTAELDKLKPKEEKKECQAEDQQR